MFHKGLFFYYDVLGMVHGPSASIPTFFFFFLWEKNLLQRLFAPHFLDSFPAGVHPTVGCPCAGLGRLKLERGHLSAVFQPDHPELGVERQFVVVKDTATAF